MAQAAPAIVGWDPIARTWSVQRDQPGTVALPSQLVGKLSTSEPQLQWAAEDWGHLTHYRPRATFHPADPDDLRVLLAWGHEYGVTVAARGGGHSVSGQSQAAGGIVVDMNELAEVEYILDDRVTVQAGAQWNSLLHAAILRGRTPPVLTDYLSTSVGGTLSGGGVGGASQHYGFQTDQVLALEVVTPQGGMFWCTPRQNRELFDAVRAGYGQIGIITRVVLPLVPAPTQVCWRRLYYANLETYVGDQYRIVTEQRFDYLEGQMQANDDGTWGFIIEAVTYGHESADPTEDLQHDRLHSTSESVPYMEFADRMGPAERMERASGAWQWPHPMMNVFIPHSQIHRIVHETLHQMAPPDVGPGGVALLYALPTAACNTPLLRLPNEDVVWLMAIIRKIPPDEPELLQKGIDGNNDFLARAQFAGGYPYHAANYASRSPEYWRQHFGDAWAILQPAKHEHDPRNILTPGQNIFDSCL